MQTDIIYDCTSRFVYVACKSTGKERDRESGLDYFEARYYGSSIGRFMSSDWSSDPDAVPYAEFENPQSPNLYSYGGNNPLSYNDPDGHTVTVYSNDTYGNQHSSSVDDRYLQIRTTGEQ